MLPPGPAPPRRIDKRGTSLVKPLSEVMRSSFRQVVKNRRVDGIKRLTIPFVCHILKLLLCKPTFPIGIYPFGRAIDRLSFEPDGYERGICNATTRRHHGDYRSAHPPPQLPQIQQSPRRGRKACTYYRGWSVRTERHGAPAGDLRRRYRPCNRRAPLAAQRPGYGQRWRPLLRRQDRCRGAGRSQRAHASGRRIARHGQSAQRRLCAGR